MCERPSDRNKETNMEKEKKSVKCFCKTVKSVLSIFKQVHFAFSPCQSQIITK